MTNDGGDEGEGHRGDPSGLRVARRRHAALGEAGRILRALQALLRAAGIDAAAFDEPATRMAVEERNELMRTYGRIEPRTRFKGRKGQPLQEQRPRNWLHVDESGRSISQPEGPNPYFTLGAIAMTEESAADYIRRAEAVKMAAFGATDITFHEPKMRNREDRFYFGGNVAEQKAFDDAMNELVDGTEFTSFGVAIRKDAYEKEFVATGVDPYLPMDVYSLAIQMLLERYVDFLAFSDGRPMGVVSFESIGPKEDAEHQRDYADLLLHGTQWVPDSAFRNYLETGVRFVMKAGSAPSELADMWARELFEWSRAGWASEIGRWRLFERRIYCRGDLQMGKFGVKVFPDSDIRELIESHRDSVGRRRAEN